MGQVLLNGADTANRLKSAASRLVAPRRSPRASSPARQRLHGKSNQTSALAFGRAISASHPNTPSMIQRGWFETSRAICRATSSLRFAPNPSCSQCNRSRSITGIWTKLAMASANVLFPDPLFPIITVRSARGSSIHVTDYSRGSCKITCRSLVIEAIRSSAVRSTPTSFAPRAVWGRLHAS